MGQLGRGLNRSDRNSHYCDLEKGSEVGAKLVIAGRDTAELLKLVEEAFDEVALAVDRLCPAEPALAPDHVGNVGDSAAGLEMLS